MSYRILILGASYGSLLGTKLLAAGHDVTLVCRSQTAALINAEGTEVRIRLRGEDDHRAIRSRDLPGKLDAVTPDDARPGEYDLVCLAMQEPQYSVPTVADLLRRTAEARVPCMSIMNMPPKPYMKRLPSLADTDMDPAFHDARVWDAFEPGLVTLCSPDPQAFRPPEEAANVLHVGLPTNFKVSIFDDSAHNVMLREIEAGIDAYRLDGKDVPVKLRVFESLYVPFAKWAMLATGNYRAIQREGVRSIRDAVHGDLDASREIYRFVNGMVEKLGAEPDDMVPFEKYAEAANGLLKPSSAARAVDAGATDIERVDKLMQIVAGTLGLSHPVLDEIVATVDARLAQNAQAQKNVGEAVTS